jgi:hypothetical protein
VGWGRDTTLQPATTPTSRRSSAEADCRVPGSTTLGSGSNIVIVVPETLTSDLPPSLPHNRSSAEVDRCVPCEMTLGSGFEITTPDTPSREYVQQVLDELADQERECRQVPPQPHVRSAPPQVRICSGQYFSLGPRHVECSTPPQHRDARIPQPPGYSGGRERAVRRRRSTGRASASVAEESPPSS